MQHEDERARTVVREAIKALGAGLRAAEWLGRPNGLLGGQAPLVVARESPSGFARVRAMIAAMRVAPRN